ncbi:MAG: thioredoxin family protein [Chromatiaceae bacterium]
MLNLFLVLSLCWLLPLPAWGNPVSTENVTARLVSERPQAVPGGVAELLLVLEIRPHWHTYWRNPGDSGEPPRIDWILPAGVSAGPLGFTAPSLIRVGPLANFGYSDRALHPVRLSVPAHWPHAAPIPVKAQVHWLVCEEHCIPESAVLDLTLPVGNQEVPPDPALSELFAQARSGLPMHSGSGAVLSVSGDGLSLSVPLSGLQSYSPAAIESVRFFPANWGLIEHASDQPWRLESDRRGARLEIGLTPGPAFETTPADGVLVIRGSDGVTRSFELTPARGPATPVAPGDRRPLGFATALAFALLGGLILNLMPCVFPVLAIKALSLAGQGGVPTRLRAIQGLDYTAGVLVFFALLAGILIALRAGGAAVGWGFQLQYPPFVAAMAYLFLVLGLSLSGALTLGGRLMGLAGKAPGGVEGRAGAFLTGALAALVAAPCTAPFMGAALGFAVTLSWLPALAIMLTLGFGLASPVLLLSLWPGLARRLPKPGAWMETFKQVLAFPLFATAAWLVWVLSVQSGPDGVALVLGGMLVLAFGFWMRERTRMGGRRLERIGVAALLAGLIGALWLGLLTDRRSGAGALPEGPSADGPSQGNPTQQPYSPERLAEARSQDRPVFVNMTAAWCITCLVNERVALAKDSVAERFATADVLYLKGDWTNRDPQITDFLAGFGRTGVPLYVYYPPGGEPRVLPQILTPSIVTEALARPGPGPTTGDPP